MQSKVHSLAHYKVAYVQIHVNCPKLNLDLVDIILHPKEAEASDTLQIFPKFKLIFLHIIPPMFLPMFSVFFS